MIGLEQPSLRAKLLMRWLPRELQILDLGHYPLAAKVCESVSGLLTPEALLRARLSPAAKVLQKAVLAQPEQGPSSPYYV